MFRDLHNLARLCTGLTVGIVAEDEYRLRVTVQPIAGDKAPIIIGMVLTGTPEELDEGFTEAIETYQAPVASLLEQAQAAAAAVGKGKAEPKALPAPAAKATKPAKGKLSKPAKAPPPDRTPAAADTAPAPASEPTTEPSTEGQAATEPDASAATLDTALDTAAEPDLQAAHGESTHNIPTTEGTGPRVKVRTAPRKPDDAETIANDRLACIADMRAYLAGNAASDKPVKPGRADYLNKYKPATGRRYERLFASFDELIAAAQQQALPEVGEPAPTAEAQQPGETNQPSGTDADCAAPDTAVVASAPDTAIGGVVTAFADVDLPGTLTPEQAANHPHGHRANLQIALKDLQAPPADATDTLFKGPIGFSLDII